MRESRRESLSALTPALSRRERETKLAAIVA
jgi:hypothetical protein